MLDCIDSPRAAPGAGPAVLEPTQPSTEIVTSGRGGSSRAMRALALLLLGLWVTGCGWVAAAERGAPSSGEPLDPAGNPVGDNAHNALSAPAVTQDEDMSAARAQHSTDGVSETLQHVFTQAARVIQDDWSREQRFAFWNEARGDAYALDPLPRFLDEGVKKVPCAREGLVTYRGTQVPYWGAVTVQEPFLDRLVRFEEVLVEVAIEIYGRPPHRIRHLGAYNCRLSRNRSSRVSEHALGNAIDIAGFDFAALSRQEAAPEGLPRALRGPFQVRVKRHWSVAGGSHAALHAQFLQALTQRLRDRQDVFRVMLGPSHRGHSDHFHFDMSPWRYVHL